MFEDVPEELNRRILDAPPELKRPRVLFELATRAVTQFYLGTTYFDSPEPFLRFPKRLSTAMPWETSIRIAQVADAVFALRNEPGFKEICRRLRTRDLRSAFFEAKAAAMFREHGFSILAREATGVLGDDFDFAIQSGGTFANVEATALTVPNFQPNTVANALGRKRGQLPSDAPAIIVCFAPGAWRIRTWDLNSELSEAAASFLRSTRRINYLMFVEDVLLRRGEGGAAFLHALHFRNERPRHPCEMLDKMLLSANATDAESRALLANTPVGESAGTGELHQWVEWLLRR